MNTDLDERIDNLLTTYQNKKTFSGCSVVLSKLEKHSFQRWKWYKGRHDDTGHSLEVDEKTLFDLASLTKPLVTVLCLLCLIKEKRVHWQDSLSHLFPMALPEDKKHIRLIDLVCHTSGLPAHRSYFKKMNFSKKRIHLTEVVSSIFKEQLASIPGQKYIYSDLDYLLLGYLIEFLSGRDLASYWREKIATPLGVDNYFYLMGESEKRFEKASFAVTGKCPWSGTLLAGVVHDDNCRALGKISGHAGLFGTLTGVIYLCEHLLLCSLEMEDNSSFHRTDLQYILQAGKGEQWACGFDVPTGVNPSCGRYFSPKTIGHLGFTGTSFWIDVKKRNIVVVLTNRVIHGSDNKNIKEMRPVLHDALLTP